MKWTPGGDRIGPLLSEGSHRPRHARGEMRRATSRSFSLRTKARAGAMRSTRWSSCMHLVVGRPHTILGTVVPVFG